MKRYLKIIIGILFLIYLPFISCQRDLLNFDKNDILKYWIFDGLRSVYLWNNTIPSTVNLQIDIPPENFFYSLIYDEEDKWSWITDNLTELEAELAGTPFSMGYSPIFLKPSSNNHIYAVVAFIYKGSPADIAGLQRGDIIFKINGMELTEFNYQDLMNLPSYNASLGKYESGSFIDTGVTINLNAQVLSASPVIYYEILEVNGNQTGYLVYSEFIPGKNDIFLNQLKGVLDEFKSAGITELIVDLRYNRGGEPNVAAYMASGIAPYYVVSGRRTFARFVYNSDVQSYIRNNEGTNSEKLLLRFPENNYNLDLRRVFVLTGRNTASASELLIIGLKPYMEVVSIGDNTYGKYTGMWIIPDVVNPPRHTYGMIPVVNRFSNSAGFTDFKEGLVPDYYVEEDFLNLKPFGNPEDPLLSASLQIISGISPPETVKKATTYLSFELLLSQKQKLKSNLFIKPFTDF